VSEKVVILEEDSIVQIEEKS